MRLQIDTLSGFAFVLATVCTTFAFQAQGQGTMQPTSPITLSSDAGGTPLNRIAVAPD